MVKVNIEDVFDEKMLCVRPVEYHNGKREQFMRYVFEINYCPMCRQKIKLGGSMRVLEHGNFYQENKIIKCICGCKFEYEQNDIMTDSSLAYTTCPAQYKRYVRCPECDAKTELGTTYSHSITYNLKGADNID